MFRTMRPQSSFIDFPWDTMTPKSPSVVAPSSLLTGLVAYYALENVNDSHTGGYTLTNTGGTTFVSGKLNNCARFVDADNKRLSSANSIFELPTGSISLWLNTTQNASYNLIAGTVNGYFLSMNGTKIGWYDFGGTGDNYGTTDVNDGAWHHIVFRWDSGVSNGTTVYLDGVLEKTGQLTVGSYEDFEIGGRASEEGQDSDADIDECGVWNRVITTGEIAALYGSGTPPAYPFTGILA